MLMYNVHVQSYWLMHEPEVITRSSATRVPVQTNSSVSLVRMAATQQ